MKTRVVSVAVTSAVTFLIAASRDGGASAINDLSREVGGAIGIAVIVVFLLLSRHTSRPATASTSHHAAPKVEVTA